MDQWWKDRTVYQVWPRSFQDSDGDGVGDLPGLVSRLDHLAWLGVGVIWLSPVYPSPMADMGYDIADYRDIHPEFGTLADFDRLVEEAGRRDIRIVMDLVPNHTSDRHPWFLSSASDRASPHRDWYIWRDPGPDGGPPSALGSTFGGPAWAWHEATGQYYLHLFTKEQPDLNWSNPDVRHAIHDVMRFWLDRGVAGFRMDVVDLIGKDVDRGITADGPMLHPYLQEMHQAVLAGRDETLTVAEAWSATVADGPLYSGRDRGEVDMVFQFAHIVEGWDPDAGKWRPRDFDLVGFKRVWGAWQDGLADDGWNALFLGNHDLPRAASRYGDGSPESAKALATAIFGMKGTPYVYQGDEIGMTNAGFGRLDQYRDVETLNMAAERMAGGMTEAEFLVGAGATSRDNARTPVQWDDGPGAGFTEGEPWIGLGASAGRVTVAAQKDDPDSVLWHHRRLIALRKDHAVMVSGRYRAFAEDHPQVWLYAREGDGARAVIAANLSARPARIEVPREAAVRGTALIGARAALEGMVELAPWESCVILSA